MTAITIGKKVSMLPGTTMMTLELDEEQGYYTLGHVTLDTPVYVLSVTIMSASRLSQVCPSVCLCVCLCMCVTRDSIEVDLTHIIL